jgi:RNA polymerase sigma factor (sigma-70 family)
MTPHDPAILGALLDRHAAALTLYARQWCAAPEDVVQEAFLHLLKQRQMPDNPAAWLYRAVRNAAISAARSEQRRQRRESKKAEEATAWFQPSEDTGLDAAAAADALRELPPEQREAIIAHLWGGLSFAEIGELMDTSASTAHRTYGAGLAALRTLLGVPCPSQPTTRT